MTKTEHLALAILLATITGIATPAPAAGRPEGEPAGRQQEDPGGRREEGEELRRSLGLMFLHRIRTELHLTDAQVLGMLPHIEAMETIRRNSSEARRELAVSLERAAEQAGTTDEAALALIRALDDEERRTRDRQDAERDAILALLTPQQKARFVLASNRLRQRIERQLQRQRNQTNAPDGDSERRPRRTRD